jgi:phosphoglucomutase
VHVKLLSSVKRRRALLASNPMRGIAGRSSSRTGLILSASQNTGGIDADFGIKYYVSNGGPAPEDITERIYQFTQLINHYYWFQCDGIEINKVSVQTYALTEIEIFDPLVDVHSAQERVV